MDFASAGVGAEVEAEGVEEKGLKEAKGEACEGGKREGRERISEWS